MISRKYDWERVALTLGYVDAHAMWKDLYLTKKLSTAAISRKLGVSQNTIRAVLVEANIPFRSRGGANNTKVSITPEIAEAITKRGLATVAKELKIKYGTLYKRYVKFRGRSLREVPRRQQAGPTARTLPDPEGGYDHAKNR